MASLNYDAGDEPSEDSEEVRICITANKIHWDHLDILRQFSKAVKKKIFVESIVNDQITCFCFAEDESSAEKIVAKLEKFRFPVLIYQTDANKVKRSETEIEEFQNTVATLIFRAKRQIEESPTSFYNLQTLQVFKNRCNSLLNNLRTLDPKFATERQLHELMSAITVECNRQRNPLPVYKYREEILRKVSENQVSIITGETGSGKSTQLAQYLYEAGFAGKQRIVITQPRKVAAISLAKRVAQEMNSELGKLVGYKTGAKKVWSRSSKILFVTAECLFNECLADSQFSSYSCIIIDEAHERSIYTDLLLSMIKKCIQKRSDLAVIITSATINPKFFVDYFNTAPEMSIPGAVFPVDVMYEEYNGKDEFKDYERRAVQKAITIHTSEGPGDILIFLTSPAETLTSCREFETLAKDSGSFQCFTLFGQMSATEMSKVFNPLPPGTRKIVFATNCAETAITIHGIKFVIDTGLAKELKYDPERGISLLSICTISKSSADQRKGRAGRTQSGKCFRLYSQQTYDSMESMSRPEIFKINLGQAALKMAAENIDFFSFEFVEPPPNECIRRALKTLQEIGAIIGRGITDIGRWIAKLNCDPRIGLIIYLGNQENLLYDTVVFAGLLSIGGNVFFRGVEESEQQLFSKTKSQYDSMDGDIFTWLYVYQDWIQQPKDERYDWCQERALNYKMLKVANDWIKERIDFLENDLLLQVAQTFSKIKSDTQRIKQIFLITYSSSLCHYLGHPMAGYLAVNSLDRFYLHPSSSFNGNNWHPEWVICTQFVATTRNFACGLISVDETWIKEYIQKRILNFDIAKVKEIKVKLVHREELGATIFRTLVGDKFSNISDLEECLTRTGLEYVTVHGNLNWKTLEILAANHVTQNSLQEVKRRIDTGYLAQDEKEIAIVRSEDGSDYCGVRLLLGQGAIVKDVLFPNESNKIGITKCPKDTQENRIREKFQRFGKINQCIQGKQQDSWGIIRYSTKEEAKLAVEKTQWDSRMVASLINLKRPRRDNQFEIRLRWCRRPILNKGIAYLTFPNNEETLLFLRNKVIILPSGHCQLQISRTGNSLVCYNTGLSDEEEIRTQVTELCCNHGVSLDDMQVKVVREKVPEPSPAQLAELESFLTTTFERLHRQMEKCFDVAMVAPRESAIYFTAYVNYSNVEDGVRAYTHLLQRGLIISGNAVRIDRRYLASVACTPSVSEMCKSSIECIKTHYSDIQIDINKKRKDLHVIYIKSDSKNQLERVKNKIQNVIRGQVIKVAESHLAIFKQEGRKALRTRVEEQLNLLLICDSRKREIHIYGPSKDVQKAESNIQLILKDISNYKKETIMLKGEGKPPGLLQALRQCYGTLPEGIMVTFHLFDVQLNFIHQKMTIFGPSKGVADAVKAITNLQNNLHWPHYLATERWTPKCTSCMSEVEHSDQFYRLEFCGHGYCLECLQLMITCALNGSQLPIACAQAECLQPLVWKDIKFSMFKNMIQEDELVSKSLNHYVAKNSSQYKFCPTANCELVYEISERGNTTKWTCPACAVEICSACHQDFHQGSLCKDDAEAETEIWLSEDPINRKLCPKCEVKIEKNDGCNKMKCRLCKIHFCWKCSEMFEDSQKCYAHLVKIHSGFSDT
ncbi:ATP-dependent RNA helicase DEAH12 chloroplastic [Biomphalaria pfeifferi]|uniref:ATP-dependent RNA helicase DEAH12 chloroplastic n=1 Tax=Biomphalaria pfeifferi TaxID=112525 RepID=A0AAD8C3Z8_BIOPF|nr:ATP-dependent RNA helicase DEAH12 chloroplastic [Biomphalaria pfeifferi]